MRFSSAALSGLLAASVFLDGSCSVSAADSPPRRVTVPPRRSTQLADGFGMNIPIPREPRMPWTRRWWPRLFDSGVKWVRIGQYENSSEKTSWDWVEQTPGRYAVSPDVDEAIRSLADNGVHIEIELQYANPLYQGDPRIRPKQVSLPPPGIGQDDEPPNPIFLPPRTEEQIAAFLKYVRFMVGRYKGIVKHWELWNEPNIGYWRPKTETTEELEAKARAYGKVLARFADAVHQTDPEAKVISGGLAGPDLVFARAALAECAAKVDIVAYHTYPGFGSNHMPEEADDFGRQDGFRNQARRIPGISKDVVFWMARKDRGAVPIPLKDSVMAVADVSFLDWPEVPEAPGELRTSRAGRAIRLHWKRYGDAIRFEVQRSIDYGPWQAMAKTAPDKTEFSDPGGRKGHITYRVRAVGKHGPSAWSNPAWLDLEN